MFVTFIIYFRDDFDENVSTLKFADRAKTIFSKVKPNEISGTDNNLINKLTSEINSLKEILNLRRKRGNITNVEDQLLKLKQENELLKQNNILYSTENKGNYDIEKLIQENKILKLELQKLRSKSSFYINNNVISDKDISIASPNKKNNLSNDYNFSENSSKNFDNLKYSNANYYNKNTSRSSNLAKIGQNVVGSNDVKNLNNSNISGIKELKNANLRLKMLQELEQNTSSKMLKELEKIQKEKQKKKDQFIQKGIDRLNNIEKMEGHIKRLGYLYKDGSSIHSDYLKQTTSKSGSKILQTGINYSPVKINY